MPGRPKDARNHLCPRPCLLAFWTVVFPWAYEYATNEGALLNNIVVGMLVAALASWSAIATDAEQRHTPMHPHTDRVYIRLD
jgi:SPW repeat-containing protein